MKSNGAVMGNPDPEAWALSDQDFDSFRELIASRAGIFLSAGKRELVRSRLLGRVRLLEFRDFSAYRLHLQGLSADHGEWQEFINLLTTNKTDFFREPQHFDFLLRDFLPGWLASKGRELKIWCCASSTGEEPYSIAMALAGSMPEGRCYSILATDIDTEVLATARNGVYALEKLNDIPAGLRGGAIRKGSGSAADWFRVQDSIRERIEFRRHNLAEAALPEEGPFDLIFCRNVLIYFSRPTIVSLSEKLSKVAKPGCLLFTGHSESLQGCEKFWAGVRPAVYCKANP